MMEKSEQVRIAIIAVSVGSCAGKPTWETAADLLRTRLRRRYGEQVSVEYIELFSPRSFDFPELLKGIGDESLKLPIVLVNDQVLSSGIKLNEGLVARRVEELNPRRAGRRDE